MPKNYIVQDTKPRGGIVESIYPKNYLVEGETVVYTDTRILETGMPMGLLLSLTYPATGTTTTPRT